MAKGNTLIHRAQDGEEGIVLFALLAEFVSEKRYLAILTINLLSHLVNQVGRSVRCESRGILVFSACYVGLIMLLMSAASMSYFPVSKSVALSNPPS